jgi:two-component system sensor histidine kinase TctE
VLLRELLTNLLDNAVRYSGSGGQVTVRVATTPQNTVVLEVEDDGPGIAPDARQAVFERFYRLPDTPGNGCGLGLAIVAEIANRHGAQVSLHCGTAGRGTLARVEFGRLADTCQPPCAAL